MFDMTSRARRYSFGALFCAATMAVTACAHPQQAAPSDSGAPRQYDGPRGQRGGMRGGRNGDGMLRDLDLTQDQRAKIAVIRDRYKLQADSMRLNGAAHDSTSRTAFRSMMTQQMSDIRAVLNPDQQQKLDDRIAKMREHRHMHGGHGAPPDSSSAPPA
jgi:Spy/CpxP family protein refolding chaperone